jgi:hypothetical protein
MGARSFKSGGDEGKGAAATTLEPVILHICLWAGDSPAAIEEESGVSGTLLERCQFLRVQLQSLLLSLANTGSHVQAEKEILERLAGLIIDW